MQIQTFYKKDMLGGIPDHFVGGRGFDFVRVGAEGFWDFLVCGGSPSLPPLRKTLLGVFRKSPIFT